MASNFKVSDIGNFVAPFVNFIPLTIGGSKQPLLGFVNCVAQVMTAPPFKWNWNRSSVDFITTGGTQNYRNAPAWSSTTFSAGQIIIDSNNNGQRCIVAGTAGGSAPAWATGIFATTTDNTITWSNIGPLASIVQVSDFGFIERAQVQDINASTSTWKDLNIVQQLPRESGSSCPKTVCADSDDNASDITFRLSPVPPSGSTGLYPITIVYQKKVANYTDTAQSMSPLPDHFFHVYAYGVLALCYMYAEDPRYQMANQQFIARLLSYAEGLSEMEINIFLKNWNAILPGAPGFMARLQQGTQARQV